MDLDGSRREKDEGGAYALLSIIVVVQGDVSYFDNSSRQYHHETAQKYSYVECNM